MYGNVRQPPFQSNSTLLSAASLISGSHIGQGAATYPQMQQMISLAQQTPPPQPVPVPQPLQAFIEKLSIGLDHAAHSFNLREKVLGAGSANLQYISKETGVQISLRGHGSLYLEPNTNAEAQEPLHLLLQHQSYSNLNSAKQLAKNLVETLHQEYLQYQQASGTPLLPTTQVPPPQLNVPPPNVIANVPPPTISAPLVQHQQQLALVQQQYMPQNGLQMQLAQNGMIIQQQSPNLSIPPPTAQTSMLPMKQAANQIQLQFHQPPPTLPTQHTPIILNTQPQSIQYQYVQHTTTRDMQGNQQVTLQPIIQQAHLPQQQFFTLQQGNTSYMVPQSTIIQQHPPTHLSFIHQQAQPAQQAPQLQMQMPLMNVQPTAIQQRNELKNDLHNNDALPTTSSSSSTGVHDLTSADSNSQEDNGLDSRLDTGIVEPLNQKTVRQNQPGLAITSMPPPPLNMSVPPPVQNFIGNNIQAGNGAVTNTLVTQQQINQVTNGQTNIIGNNSWPQARGPPPPLGQPLMELQQIMPMGQQPQPLSVTFSQQPLQQSTQQQFLQLQQPAQQQQQQQFSIIQATPINGGNAFQQQQILQFQQLQPNAMQMHQQQLQFSQQQQLLQQQHQMQYQIQQQQQQMHEQGTLDYSNKTQTNVRTGQKRRSTSEPENSGSGGPPPNQQLRTGTGIQSHMQNIAMTSMPTSIGKPSNLTEAGGVSGTAELPANTGTSLQFPQQQQQHLKPTHIGVMRYNQDPPRTVYDTAYPPPRGRLANYSNAAPGGQPPLLSSNNYGQRMQFMHSQPPPPLPTTGGYGAVAGPKRMPRP